MTQEDSDGPGFSVVDKRHGREDEEASPPEAARPDDAPPPRQPEPQAEPGGEDAVLGIDFATFLISLSTSALYHLGLVAESEDAAPPEPNLPMARQTIDILDLIQQKTQGNLDDQETHLLESLLYELRMRFVEIQNR